jgi:hypothetical protein
MADHDARKAGEVSMSSVVRDLLRAMAEMVAGIGPTPVRVERFHLTKKSLPRASREEIALVRPGTRAGLKIA